MKLVKLVLALALAITAFLAMVTPSPAGAADQRPCVSKTEAEIHHHGDARRNVELGWEVKGLGGVGVMATLLDPSFNTYIVDYPRCGFNDTEAGVSVFYREDDDTVRFVMIWKRDTATLHGHNRLVR